MGTKEYRSAKFPRVDIDARWDHSVEECRERGAALPPQASTGMPELKPRAPSQSSASRASTLQPTSFNPLDLPEDVSAQIVSHLSVADVLKLSLTNKAAAKELIQTLSSEQKKQLKVLVKIPKINSLGSLKALLGSATDRNGAPVSAAAPKSEITSETTPATTLRDLPQAMWYEYLSELAVYLPQIPLAELPDAIKEFRAMVAELALDASDKGDKLAQFVHLLGGIQNQTDDQQTKPEELGGTHKQADKNQIKPKIMLPGVNRALIFCSLRAELSKKIT
jgi:hypothetical protein